MKTVIRLIPLLLFFTIPVTNVLALETKSYPSLKSRITFQGSKKACAYRIHYQGGTSLSAMQTASSYSSSANVKIRRKTFGLRQTSFPITPLDFIRLIRNGEASVTNSKFTYSLYTQLLKKKDLQVLKKSDSNLAIVTTAINGLSSSKPNLISGIYYRNNKKKMLFALAAISPKAFSLSETCIKATRNSLVKKPG